jgi:four helix bundle protein
MGKSYRDLIAWQKGIELVAAIYRETKAFPPDEIFGLTSQLRRASVSIPSNIAEGQARKSTGEFKHFLHLALGSLAEVETQLTITAVLVYLPQRRVDELLLITNELGRILNGLLNAVSDHITDLAYQ